MSSPSSVGAVGASSSASSREPELGGGRHAFEVAAGPLGAREAVDERPEVGPVPGHEQVGELVDQDVVDDPGRHPLQPGREPDGAVGRRARSPPAALVGDPADRRRAGPAVQVRRDRSRARAISSSSLGRSRASWRASRSSMTDTQRRSSARLIRAGIRTMVRSPSR